jgi:deoxyribonuclease IV
MAPMLSEGPRLGAHLPIADGLVRAAERATAIGADALQVFADNPTAWGRRAEPSPEIADFRSALGAAGIQPLVVHASYLINLAGSDDELRNRSIELLTAELEAAARFGARILNVHTGSNRGGGLAAGIDRLVDGVLRAVDAVDASTTPATLPVVALENSSGGGGGIGLDVGEWAAIARAFDRSGLPRSRVAFCLDTAHCWGAGIDVGRPAAVDELLAAFEREIGLDRLALVHLNDTRTELGSRMDRHEHVGAGRIGAAGLGHLLRHPGLAAVPFILETPGMEDGYDAVNLARARALARDEALEPLPPEAFTLERRSRMRSKRPGTDDGAAPATADEAAATAGVPR